MALSNWATLTINEKGEPIGGIFQSSLVGIWVEFYKNWLYLHDDRAWRKESGWAKDVVMEIQEGEFNYQNLKIKAVRGPKNGIYAVVSEGYRYNKTFKAIVGIGCYGWAEGYDEEGEPIWNGIEKAEEEFLAKQLYEWGMIGKDKDFSEDILKKSLTFNQGNMFFTKHLGIPLGANPVK